MTTNKQQIFEAARYFVNSFGVEPREGFVANELSAKVSALVEISIEGRSKGQGIAIVRFKGEVVAHEFSGTFVEGEWIEFLMAQYEVSKRLDKQVAGIPMWEALKQNTGCNECMGSGYVHSTSDLYDGVEPCQACNASEAYVTLHPAQNAPKTVRWNNAQYVQEAKAAGGVLVIKTEVA